MKNRDLFIPSFTTLIIFGLSWFLNCAHQNRVRDGIDAGVEQMDDADLSSTEGSEETDDLALESSSPEQAPSDEKATELSDSDLNELTGDSIASSETKSGATADSLNVESDLAQLDPQNTTGVPSESTGTLMADPTAPPDSLLIPEPTAPIEPDPVVAQAPDVTQEIQAIPTTPPFEESSFDAPKAEAPKATRSAWKSSRVPKIPANAVTRNGKSLNRFYFVRQGDTARSVASLVYGDDQKTKELKAWNKGWAAGDVVYYVSPTEPEDRKMRSFYQENSITPDEYKVQRGDWLSRIASKKLGNAGSWKEIAVVNGLKSADSLEVGHKLAIYPRDLAQFTHEPQIVENMPAPEPEPQFQAPVMAQPIPEPQAQPQAEIAIPTPQPEVITPEPRVVTEQPAVEAESLSPKKNKNQDVDFGKFVEQNIVAAVIIGGMVMLLLALASRRKKRARAQSSDEFGDDLPGEPPTKIKRK